MNIEYLLPKDVCVQSFVERYLILNSKDKLTSYTCYPNTNHCLGVIRNHAINWCPENSSKNKIELIANSKPTHYTTGIYNKPMEFIINGAYKEICIDIKPLGLSLFGINNEKSSIVEVEPLNHINQDLVKNLYELVHNLDSMNSLELITALDSILRNAIKVEISHEIEYLKSKGPSTIQELQQILYMSNRSLYRFFTRKLKLTPYKFLEIMRLQNCIKDVINSKDLKSVYYEYGFTDASHFNKFIKKYTHLSPTSLKADLSLYDDLVLKK